MTPARTLDAATDDRLCICSLLLLAGPEPDTHDVRSVVGEFIARRQSGDHPQNAGFCRSTWGKAGHRALPDESGQRRHGTLASR